MWPQFDIDLLHDGRLAKDWGISAMVGFSLIGCWRLERRHYKDVVAHLLRLLQAHFLDLRT
jgi:hypothetical protein